GRSRPPTPRADDPESNVIDRPSRTQIVRLPDMKIDGSPTRAPRAPRIRWAPAASLIVSLAMASGSRMAHGDEIAEPKPVGLRVFPTSITLSSARDRQGIVVQAEYADGSTRDVSGLAAATIRPGVAAVSDGVVAPKAGGKGILTVGLGGLHAEA